MKKSNIVKNLFKITISRPIKIIKSPFLAVWIETKKWMCDFIYFYKIISYFFIKKQYANSQEINNQLNGKNKYIDKTIYNQKYLANVNKNIKPLISFVSPMRFKNNIEHNPKQFLDSLIENTKNLNNIEIIIAIDSDDIIEHFCQIKQEYSNKIQNLKILVSPEKYGYQKLQLYDAFLYNHISPSSKMIVDFSDDCQITVKNWDEIVLKIDSKFKDNIYFIHTNNIEREKYVGELKNNLAKLIWCEQAIGPASYFPIVSRGILEIAQECHKKLSDEEQKKWSPFSNSTFFDCYIDIISHSIEEGKEKRVFYQNLISINHQFFSEKRNDVIIFDSNINLAHKKQGLTPNDLGFIKLLQPQTQKHLETICSAISEKILNS